MAASVVVCRARKASGPSESSYRPSQFTLFTGHNRNALELHPAMVDKVLRVLEMTASERFFLEDQRIILVDVVK